MTLYASTLADVAMFAANDVALGPTASARSGARLILVDASELAWQRAHCREARHLLVPADPCWPAPTRCNRGCGEDYAAAPAAAKSRREDDQ
jgi:hypothetical protein